MMNNASEPAAEATGLRVVRGGRTVLDDLDFTLPRGRITGLLGPSGCGKSTLIRALVGSQAHVTGTLTVLGRPAGHRSLRPRVGYVTQAPSVYTDLSARQNLDYYAAVLGIARHDRAAHVDRVLSDVDLTSHADALVGNLSGGQRGRVSLAVALLGDPELLVLDEPTVGLDPVLRRDLWQLFHRLADERGTTVLVSSHVMDEAERCHGLLLLREGRLLADDTPDELRRRTGAETVEDAFLRLVDEANRQSRGHKDAEGEERGEKKDREQDPDPQQEKGPEQQKDRERGADPEQDPDPERKKNPGDGENGNRPPTSKEAAPR